LIAASYTPIAFIALSGGWRIGVLASVWFIAVLGSATSWKSALFPHWVIALLYVSTGWVAIIAIPLTMFASLGFALLLNSPKLLGRNILRTLVYIADPDPTGGKHAGMDRLPQTPIPAG